VLPAVAQRRARPHIFHTRTPGCSRRRRQPVADGASGTQPSAAVGSISRCARRKAGVRDTRPGTVIEESVLCTGDVGTARATRTERRPRSVSSRRRGKTS
jgi:hypothetical protein